MTMQTPIEPSSPQTAPTSDAAAGQWAAPPPPAVKRGWPVWAWLLLGLAVLLAAGAVVAVVVAGGGEDTAVVNTHTAEAGEPALISVPGYAYEDLTGDRLATFEEKMAAGFTPVNEQARSDYPELGDFWLGWSGHIVVAADGEDAHLILASVNEDYLDAGVMTEKDVVIAMTGSLAVEGSTVTTETIAGEKVVVEEDGGDYTFAWFHDGVVTMADGPDEGDTRAFVEAYLETAHQRTS